MPLDPSTLDELGFKQMVRRAWGGECCPLALRDRMKSVSATVPLGPAEEPLLSIRPSGIRLRTWGLAAAAVALAIGLPALRHGLRRSAIIGASATIASAGSADFNNSGPVVPVSLEQDLVDTHERCSHQADHHQLAAGVDNDAVIAAAMRVQLSRAVLVARPTEPDWHFKGAAICRVGTIPCGHLVFSKGDEAISVFSLPASADPSLRDGDEISAVAGGHPIAGFAKDGAIFCLVGSSPDMAITSADLRQMRDRMESEVMAGPPSTALLPETHPEPETALAELLQPISQ